MVILNTQKKKKLDQGENALARILDNFAVGFVLKCLLNLKRR